MSAQQQPWTEGERGSVALGGGGERGDCCSRHGSIASLQGSILAVTHVVIIEHRDDPSHLRGGDEELRDASPADQVGV